MEELTKQQKFIQLYYDDAVKTQLEFGVPLLVTLAQAALESAWGKSAPGNMFFGVKAGKTWKGKKQLLNTTECIKGKTVKTKAWFRAYDEPYDSFKDHALVLKQQFPIAFRFKNNPDEFIRSVQRDHENKYATDPLYTSKIISLMSFISLTVQELKLNNSTQRKA